ncbi:MAG: hypothetical protein A2W90_17715 [Bacteroidetes bacterium GWF2_42_66]|nr:MAG: hypothetical protein A2W92_16630 [Bacteroidetes bacterium GWA2_42_15]OFX98093.1 MAG: hypothetical protein A2W89_09205 [Bacteroidetes bacterium GWE2_42_39]OFY42477.1 MAG: hypothetical protein A2W90_17715 [Bacteroidetes bacterium GWF2_42_66]HBL74190.1 RagB/SusD family nutrient uptake outer membrane protein [Prolixibacteraceae bacterium]HCR91675.1 RagB/SusD family nutrient uptake outer membrane protein [Prolixibacteraceae bacterium]
MKNALIICLIIMSFASCSDILQEKPQAIAVETFYNTAGEVEAGIAAIYSPLRNSNAFGAIYLSLLDCSSDQVKAGRGSWQNPSEFQGLNTTNVTRAQGVWTQFYLSIRNANLIIQNVPNSTILNDADKNKYIGEAKFLRALTYFHLIRNWGAVPLKTEENFNEFNVPRTSETDIYKLIVSDLEFAESGLPDAPKVAGCPSKWSAKTVLADVYFYQGQYDKAVSKSDEVIKSGKYSLVEVSKPEDFEKLFGAAVVSSTEEIFYLKYNNDQPWTHPQYLHGVKVPYIGVDGYYVTQSNINYTVYKNWDDNDLRKIYGWYAYSGFDPGTMLNKKFNDLGSKTPKNDYPLYRYADLLLIHAEASCKAAGNPTSAGVEALNKVHRRAYGYPSTQVSPVDFKASDFNRDSFIDLCVKERGYETQGEGKRWLDLKRLGKEKAAAIIMATRGVNISESHYLWPIPLNEISYNKAITDQNPGY